MTIEPATMTWPALCSCSPALVPRILNAYTTYGVVSILAHSPASLGVRWFVSTMISVGFLQHG